MTRLAVPLSCSLALLLLACPGADGDPGEIDGITLPDPSGVSWAAGVDNPFFPLPVGATWHYEAQTPDGLESDDVEVLAETREVNGVTATVVHDVVRLDGEIVEETWDWYAQDTQGNVWYLGEDTCEWQGGACAVMEGAWEWGVDGARPGIIMPADPTVDGQPYFQEYDEDEAEDVGEVIATGESISVPAGDFSGCVRTRDSSHLDPDLDEEKVYCPGVGNVFVAEPEANVSLLSYTGL
ncbi:MAG: hypothetical protein KC431_22495 [Myxococcales bacterium]|nr:hypothetical protein [Myxococcales bacterium]